jgi:hypothetical protein
VTESSNLGARQCWDAKRKGEGSQISPTRLAGSTTGEEAALMPWGAVLFQAELTGSNCCVGWRCDSEQSGGERKNNKTIQLSSVPGRSDAAANRNSGAAVPIEFGCRFVRVDWISYVQVAAPSVCWQTPGQSGNRTIQPLKSLSSELTKSLGAYS